MTDSDQYRNRFKNETELLKQKREPQPGDGAGLTTFAKGDTVSKINSHLTDKVQDGEIGIVTDSSPQWVCVLFIGQGNDLLVRPEQVEIMYPIAASADAVAAVTGETDNGARKRVVDTVMHRLTEWFEEYLDENIGEDILANYYEGFTFPQVASDLDVAIKKWATKTCNLEDLTELVYQVGSDWIDEEASEND